MQKKQHKMKRPVRLVFEYDSSVEILKVPLFEYRSKRLKVGQPDSSCVLTVMNLGV